jgi:AMP-activated protein kinase-like protein
MSRGVSKPNRAVLAFLLVCVASSSDAQSARPFIDVQPMGVTAPRVETSTLSLGSGLDWRSPNSAAWFRGSADVLGSAFALRTFDGELRATLRRFGAFDFGVDSRAQFDAQRDGERYGSVTSGLRVSTGSPNYGVRLGAGATASQVPGAGLVAASAKVGGWIRVLGVSGSGELTMSLRPGLTTLDTVVPRTVGDTGTWIMTDSGLVHVPGQSHTEWIPVKLRLGNRARVNEARFALGAYVTGIFLDGTGGFFFAEGRNPSPHGLITATRWISPRVALMAGAGIRTIDPVAGLQERAMVFGLRLAPRRVVSGFVDAPNAAASQLAIARQGARVMISVRAAGARSVEIAGDFTNWNAVTLSRERSDVWTVALPLAPGVYRLNLRVDEGQWQPPPGASRVIDAYEGTVGVVVVN